MKKLKLIYASSWAAMVAIVFATGITIWAELSAPLKNWLKSVSGHHWTTKSIFTAGVFVVALVKLYILKRDPADSQIRRALNWLFAVAIFVTCVLFLFFLRHYLNG